MQKMDKDLVDESIEEDNRIVNTWARFWSIKQQEHDLSEEEVAEFQNEILQAYRFVAPVLLLGPHPDKKAELEYIQAINACIHQHKTQQYEYFIEDQRIRAKESVKFNIKSSKGKNAVEITVLESVQRLVKLHTTTSFATFGSMLTDHILHIVGNIKESQRENATQLLWQYALYQLLITKPNAWVEYEDYRGDHVSNDFLGAICMPQRCWIKKQWILWGLSVCVTTITVPLSPMMLLRSPNTYKSMQH